MKRAVTLLLALALLLTGCGQGSAADVPAAAATPVAEPNTSDTDIASNSEVAKPENTSEQSNIANPELPQFTDLDDPTLREYTEDTIYEELVSQLGSDDYFVENVSTIYLSKEYLDEVEFNSQTNIFFGYSLADLDAQFEGTRYVFTLGEDGKTAVEPFEEYDEDTCRQVIKNVATSSGVILVCVTVSVISGAAGASTISLIFATAAKTGAIYALKAGSIGAISAGLVTGVQTGDFDQALKQAAIAGSEGLKWGTFAGTMAGGLEGVQTVNALKGTDLNGLTLDQAAAIQMKSKFHIETIKSLHSKDEYDFYVDAGLKENLVNDHYALTQKIDWNFIGDAEDGRTNAQRVHDNLAPLDPTGNPYELHHIGQKEDSPLAILTSEQHRGKGNTSILHQSGVPGVDHGANWEKIKNDFWKAYYELTKEGV